MLVCQRCNRTFDGPDALKDFLYHYEHNCPNKPKKFKQRRIKLYRVKHEIEHPGVQTDLNGFIKHN